MHGRSKKTLIIGLGNSLIGDDAFGPRVVQRLLSEAAALPADAEVIEAHTDLLGMVDQFEAYKRVVLVDAVLDPEGKLGDAGSAIVFEEQALASWPVNPSSAHQISPLLAIRLFRQLHPAAETRISLVGLCTDGLALPSATGEGCKALCENAVTDGARLVKALLHSEKSGADGGDLLDLA